MVRACPKLKKLKSKQLNQRRAPRFVTITGRKENTATTSGLKLMLEFSAKELENYLNFVPKGYGF